jgi:nucleotide-binding universal stress UspA family protein
MISKILVALDQAAPSQYIFEQSIFLAKAANATIIMLHVISPLGDNCPSSIHATSSTEAVNKYIQTWEDRMQQKLSWLSSLKLQATEAGVKTELIQDTGNAGRIICQSALNWQIDLIIVGRRGHTGINEMLLGSVSNYVLHHSPCSVLTIQGFVSTTSNIPKTRQTDSSAHLK